MVSRTQHRKPLPDAEIRRLIRLYRKDGDTDALRRVVESNLGLAHGVAKAFASSGIDMDDLFQESVVGLIHGCERYDPDRPSAERITTYVHWWCRAYVMKFVGKNVRAVTFSRSAVARDVLRAIHEMQRVGALEVSAVAEQTGRSLEVVNGVIAQMGHDRPMNEVMANKLADHAPGPEELAIDADSKADAKARAKAVLSALSPREAMVVRRRIMAEKQATLAELGKEMGLSRERVRQIEAKAMKRLRKAMKRLQAKLAA